MVGMATESTDKDHNKRERDFKLSWYQNLDVAKVENFNETDICIYILDKPVTLRCGIVRLHG